VCSWFGIVCDEDSKAVIGIELSRVNLSGTIAAEIGILSNLQFIDLSENEIIGTIPIGIRQLPNLSGLNLAFNQLQGSLERFHPDLGFLNVSHNELNGLIGSDFGVEADNLEVLDASFNRIRGVLPSSLGRMPHLKLLNLSHNQVSFDSLENEAHDVYIFSARDCSPQYEYPNRVPSLVIRTNTTDHWRIERIEGASPERQQIHGDFPNISNAG